MPLTSSPTAPQPLRNVVNALREYIDRCGLIWVEGQIIELNRRRGKLHFLTLRDPIAEVSVSVSVETSVLDRAGPITEGTTVTCELQPKIWTKSGRLAFACNDLRPSGEGRLLAMLEQRKRLLQAEGLFDPRLKKPLPTVPRAIGLITGAGSAAERDVHSNVLRRWPAAVFETRNTLVQGPDAAEQIIASLAELDRIPAVDVIIVARGGGSLEDLLPFSDEALARAVFACRTPVVSAIGHETDTPILDLVADHRASTPTDAAKTVVPDVVEELRQVDRARDRLHRAVATLITREQDRLTALRNRPALANPLHSFDLRHDQVTALRQRLGRALDHWLDRERTMVENHLTRVRALSPRATLARGYAIVTDADAAEVTSVDDVAATDDLRVLLSDGQLGVRVTDIHRSTRPAQEDA